MRAEFRARARRLRIPVRLQLEVTSRCNLRCRHCYVSDHARPETPLPRLLELVHEAAAQGCITISLTGGELALRGDWVRIAEEVKRERMLLSVLTSGTAFTRDDLQRLIELRPTHVAVSLYASTAELHDDITQVPGSFDRSVATLRTLRGAGVPCRVSCVLLPQTIDDFRRVAALAKGLDCDFLFDPNVVPCDDGSTDVLGLRVDGERLVGFYADDLIRGHSMEGRLAEAAEPPERRPASTCDSGVSMVFVDASGDVYPCVGFPPAFGNINEGSFASIWRGSVAEAHREAMARPLHGCPECELQPYCTTRCARLAVVEDGDLSGPSKRACEMAQVTIQLRKMFRGNRQLSPATTSER